MPSYHVALVGLPGTGKTAVGNALSNRLPAPLYDIATVFEAREGLTPAQAINQHGMSWFRAKETLAIASVVKDSPAGVVVLGAGALDRDSTRTLLRLYTQTFWLHAPLGLLAAQLVDDEGNPVFSGPRRRSVVEREIHQRLDFYAMTAHAAIWADQPGPALIADIEDRIRVTPP